VSNRQSDYLSVSFSTQLTLVCQNCRFPK